MQNPSVIHQNRDPSHVRRGIKLLGIAALLVGVATACVLYYSFGTNPVERAVYSVMGIIFAAAGGLMLPAAVELWQAERPGWAAGVFLLWLFGIVPLGLSGHVGFFSVAQSELAAQSIPAQAERARLDAIETQLQAAGGAAGVDVGGLQSQAETLQAQLRTARDKLAACPENYFKNCINPAQAVVNSLQAQLAPIENQLRGHANYAALQSQRADTVAALAAASSGAVGAGGYHPLFSTLSRLFGVDAARLQAIFLAWSAVSLELLAAISFIISDALRGWIAPARPASQETGPAPASQAIPPAVVSRPHLEPAPASDPAPALDTGGRIQADGLAHLHAGEIVLNAQAAAQLDKLAPGLADKLNALQGGLQVALKPAHNGNAVGAAGAPTQCDNGNAISHCDNGNAVDKAADKAARPGLQVLPCTHCGAEFKQRTVWQKFCGETCRNAHNGFVPRRRAG